MNNTFICEEKDGKLYAPGVGDDTANVALLMLIARYVILNHINIKNALIVFNSCEEGLGNLEGIRHIMNTYKNVKEFYSFDLTYEEIICKAVGSNRYKITISTDGGHSYSAFGNTNAIHIASEMIHDFYQYQVPKRGKSTYNVGIIEGGTSVNTIAQSASFLFEYRSDNHEDLKEMIEFFNQTIEKVEVIDLSGKTLFTFSNANSINIESLPSGAYYLRLTNNDKAIMQKIIKE